MGITFDKWLEEELMGMSVDMFMQVDKDVEMNSVLATTANIGNYPDP